MVLAVFDIRYAKGAYIGRPVGPSYPCYLVMAWLKLKNRKGLYQGT